MVLFFLKQSEATQTGSTNDSPTGIEEYLRDQGPFLALVEHLIDVMCGVESVIEKPYERASTRHSLGMMRTKLLCCVHSLESLPSRLPSPMSPRRKADVRVYLSDLRLVCHLLKQAASTEASAHTRLSAHRSHPLASLLLRIKYGVYFACQNVNVALLYGRCSEATALQRAAAAGSLADALEAMRGRDVNARGAYGESALHSAVFGGNLNVVRELVEAGARLEARDHVQCTPLMLAALMDRTPLLAFLLEKGASPHVGNKNGQSPLHVAVFRRNVEAVRLLLQHDARLCRVDLLGATPLDLDLDVDLDDGQPGVLTAVDLWAPHLHHWIHHNRWSSSPSLHQRS